MGLEWHDFLDGLKDDAGKLAKEELKELIESTRGDSADFLKRQGEKLERYLNQLAAGLTTKEQFEGYVLDVRDLTEMQALEMSVAARARAQHLAEGITSLIINGLLGLI